MFSYQLKAFNLQIILGRRSVFDDRHSPGSCSGRQSLSTFVQNVSPVRRKSLHKVRIKILPLSTLRKLSISLNGYISYLLSKVQIYSVYW